MADSSSYIPVHSRRPRPGIPLSPDPSSTTPISCSAPASWPPLLKHHSWSADSAREESWLRKQGLYKERRLQRDGSAGRLTRSVTEEDLDELRGCIDLGFAFDELESPGSTGSGRLSETFPALEVYLLGRHSNADEDDGEWASAASNLLPVSSSSGGSSPIPICSPGESPQLVKAKLKRWAQVVASSVRHRC